MSHYETPSDPQREAPPPEIPESAEIRKLREENRELRAALEKRSVFSGLKSRAWRLLLRMLVPLVDRYSVIRSLESLLQHLSHYSLPRESWPSRESTIAQFEDFLVQTARFFLRRRLLFLMISLGALSFPLLQVWLTFQQNQIIQNQDKYFNVQVYDIVARSLTGDDATAKQISTSLLAREDFNMVNGIIASVFASSSGGVYLAEDAAGRRPLFMEDTAARSYLLSALALGIQHHRPKRDAQDLWEAVKPSLALVLRDAASRLPELLRLDADALARQPRSGRECFSYLFGLSSLLSESFRLAHANQDEAAVFSELGPLIQRISGLRDIQDRSHPYTAVFTAAFQEFLLDLASPGEIARKPLKPEALAKQLQLGFRRLEAGLDPRLPGIDRLNLQDLLEVSP